MAKKNKIKIKPSRQGSLHKHLGVPEGEKIPANKLKIKSTDSEAIRKKKQFAINAKSWKKGANGLEVDEIDPTTLSDYTPNNFVISENIVQEPIYNEQLSKSLGKYYYDKGIQPDIYTPDGVKKYYEEPMNTKGSFKPTLNAFPTTGNKYLNRGLQYLNQGINHAANINNPNYQQPLNYYNGMMNPFTIQDNKIDYKPYTGEKIGVIKENGGLNKYPNGGENPPIYTTNPNDSRLTGGKYWEHRDPKYDSEAENMAEYIPVYGIPFGINDWMNAGQKFVQTPSWSTAGDLGLETASLIPFGKLLSSVGKGTGQAAKASRAGHFLDFSINALSDESLTSDKDKKDKKENKKSTAPPIKPRAGQYIFDPNNFKNGGKLKKAQTGQEIQLNRQQNNLNIDPLQIGNIPTQDQLYSQNTQPEDNIYYTPDNTFNQNKFNQGIQGLATGVNLLQSGINFGKGALDMIGSNMQNRFAQKQEADLYRQSVYSQAMNVTPYETQGYGFQGRNSLAENGMQIKEIGGFGIPNIEIEGKEHVLLPNGMSEEVQGNSHDNGGIPLNLPEGTKIFSEKLKIKTDKGKKSYADLAKKFETKKNVDMLESKTADDIQKVTAEMMINQKKLKLDELFAVQENDKMKGLHGKQVQKETMKEYQPQAEYGMKIKKAANGDDVWNAQTFKTKEGINTPTSIDLNKNPLTNWEAYRGLWETEARKAGQLKPNERFKMTKDMQEFMYDWALDNNPSLIRDMWKTYGVTNKNESKYKNLDVSNLSDENLKDLRGNFIDNYRGKRVFSPITGQNTNLLAPKGATEAQIIEKEVIKPEYIDRTKYLQPNVNPNINLGIQLPNVYGRSPLNYYKTEAEYIDPRYLDITSQLNQVTRNKRALQTNIGGRGTADISNLLQSQANSDAANQQIFNTKYNYDRAQDAQAQQFNAQAKMSNNQYNQGSWFNQLEDPIRRREGAIDTQMRLDNNAAIENQNAQMAFYNNLQFMNNTFPYYQNMTPEQSLAYAQLNNLSLMSGKAKNGKKVTIKPKMKKK